VGPKGSESLYLDAFAGAANCHSMEKCYNILLDRRGPLASSHRLQHLLWALEALGGRIRDLSDHGLRSTVALGAKGYLLFVGREVYAPQVLLEFAQVEVAQTAQGIHAHSATCLLSRLLLGLGTLPTPNC